MVKSGAILPDSYAQLKQEIEFNEKKGMIANIIYCLLSQAWPLLLLIIVFVANTPTAWLCVQQKHFMKGPTF